jgi:uncharacterized protein (TIGR00725 family)
MKQVYIGVIGAGSCSRELAAEAYTLGTYLAQNGWFLICGGLGGVMEAVSHGITAAGGTALGILPGHDRAEGNMHLTYSIVTGLGHARNLIVVESSTALVAVGGSYGTLSEISFANILQKPVIGLKSWRCASPGDSGHLLFCEQVETAQQAVQALKRYV